MAKTINFSIMIALFLVSSASLIRTGLTIAPEPTQINSKKGLDIEPEPTEKNGKKSLDVVPEPKQKNGKKGLDIAPEPTQKNGKEGLEMAPEPTQKDGKKGYDIAPGPAQGNETYLKECKKKLNTVNCGKIIENSIFQNGTITDRCCEMVSLIGEQCHEGLLRKSLSSPELQANTSQALQRSKEIWKQCDGAYLKKCEKKVAITKCGKIILNATFNNGTVTDHCCDNLVQAGKPCHQRLLKKLLSSPKYKKSQVMEKGEKLWNKCVLDAKLPSPSPSPSPFSSTN